MADWNEPDFKNQDSLLGQFASGMQYNPAARQWMLLPAEFWQRWNAGQKMWVFLQQHDVDFFKQTATAAAVKCRMPVTLS